MYLSTHKQSLIIGALIIFMSIFSVANALNIRDVLYIKFDPAVEGGVPSLLIDPSRKCPPEPFQVLVTAYELNNDKEEILDTRAVLTTGTFNYLLPHSERESILGVRVQMVDYGMNVLPVEWRALYRPGKRLVDYNGNNLLQRPPDFKEYWDEARNDLAAIPFEPEISAVPERTTETGKLYKVKLQSYNNIPIICWYYVPKDIDPLSKTAPAKKYPAIQIMPGWGAEEPPLDRTRDAYITLSLNPRAHGPSKEFFITPIEHHVWNIDNPDEYYYRAAYMDCVRGIDFLASRPEVDIERIGVEGGSQGGAFALAVAALDKRVRCVASNVPYISNFPDFVRISTNGSGRSFGRLMNEPHKGEIISRTLSYIDVSNLAPWITCPTLVCVGLQDRVCPPVNGIVALNRMPLGVARRLVTDPQADHEVTPLMRNANQDWYRTYLLK